MTQPAATRTVCVTGSTRTPLIVDKSQILVDAGELRCVVAADANGDRRRGARNQQRPYVDLISITSGRENCRNYLLHTVIGAVEMPKRERHPHKVGNSARLHLLHDRGPVMLGRPRADP